MKQIALAIVLWIIGVSSVLAQCNGVFPNNTVCGNTSGGTALPYSIPIGSSVAGPSSSTVGDFATWNNTSGSLLADTTPSEALTTLGNGEAPTGSGAVVLATSPTLTTPSLGVARATSINGLSIDTTTGVLDIANGKTLTDTSGVGADLLLGATGGGFAAYGGASCTNQVFTALSAAGSPTCSTVANADLANDAITIAGTSVPLGGSTSSLPSPGPIGGTTPSSVAATTISASGQITSTESTGTAPFVVASTTEVSNLNVAALQGDTWAAPGTIGSTTPNTGAFTTIAGDDATLSAVDPFVALNGDTSTSEGPYVEFERGGTEFGAIGSESVLIGGNNSDLALLAESGDDIQFYTNGDTTADVAIPSKATLDVGYSGGGGAVVIGGSTSGTTTLSASATAGTTTATLPDNTGTLAELNLAQTFSALQTFDTSDLAINGGSATAGLATVTSAGVVSSEANATVAQGGTGGTSASGTLLDNITGFSSTGLIDRTGAGAYSFTPPGTNVLTALGNAINAASGLPNVDGSIVTGDCLEWGPGIEDAGVTCGSGGGGSPGGSNGALQYNDAGSFGGVTIASGDIPLGGGSGAPTDSGLSPTSTGWTTQAQGTANTSLATAQFVEQSEPGGLINLFRNPAIDVNQRGLPSSGTAYTITTSGAYTADGIFVQPTGASVSAFIDSTHTAGGARQSLAVTGAASVTDVAFKMVIESYIASRAAGKRVTVQFEYYQTSGSTQTPQLGGCYFGSQDVSTACNSNEDLSATSLTACATATWCLESYSYAVNSGATNGYQSKIDCGFAVVASETCEITALDFRVTPGVSTGVNTVAPPPELPPIQYEMAFCERYFYSTYGNGVTAGTAQIAGAAGGGANNGSSNWPLNTNFPVTLRAVPSSISYWDLAGTSNKVSSLTGNSQTNNLSPPTFQNYGTNSFQTWSNSLSDWYFQYQVSVEIAPNTSQ